MSSSHPKDKQLLHKGEDGRTRHLSKPPRDLFPTWTGETYLYSESGGLTKGAKEIELLM